MKNWWRDLTGDQRKALKLLVFVLMAFCLGVLLLTYYDTTKDKIIIDSARQEIKQDISFTAWLADWWGPGERYYSIPEEIILVRQVNNIAYRAKFRFPRNNQSVKKFLADPTPGHQKFWVGLEDTVMRCIEDVRKRNYSVEGYPSMTVRAMSIANMNELCPLAQEYGYQWASSLEIAQCSNLPMDNVQQRNCEDKVRYALY